MARTDRPTTHRRRGHTVEVALNVIPRLARLVTKVLDADVNPPMTVRQFRILVRLAHGEEPVCSLAAGAGVRAPSMSQAIDGLVARGWVSRVEDVSDRRRKRVGLTSSGRTAFARAEEALASELSALLGGLDPDERRAAATGLAALNRELDRHLAALADRPRTVRT